MEGKYGVFFGKQQVGSVSVCRQGLYYRFSCRCSLPGGAVCRLQVILEDTQENLGILIPMDDKFGLDTKIPVKRLGNGKPEFILALKHEKCTGTYVAVYPEEPFAYISRLKDAYLLRKNGELGIIFK